MSLSSSSFYEDHCSLVPYLFVWFASSTALSFMNRYIFGILHFPLLLTATSFHFLIQYVFAYLYTILIEYKHFNSSSSNATTTIMKTTKFRSVATTEEGDEDNTNAAASNDNINNNEVFKDELITTDDEVDDNIDDPLLAYNNLSWKQYLEISLTVGISSALDIGLSNMGMSLIPISVYTIVKASAPLFVLALSFALKLAKPTIQLIIVFILISIGEVLATWKEDASTSTGTSDNNNNTDIAVATIDPLACMYYYEKDNDDSIIMNDDGDESNVTSDKMMIRGIILVLLSSFCSALRWTMLQYKLSSLPNVLRTPMMTLRIISPTMFLSLFFIAIILERTSLLKGDINTCSNITIVLGFSNGVVAIPLMLAEYGLLLRSSAIVLMIGGVCKEIVTIGLGVFVFHEVVTKRSWLGFGIVTCGALLYKYQKMKSKQQEQELNKQQQQDEETVAINDNNNNITSNNTKEKDGSNIEMTHQQYNNEEPKDSYFTIDDDDENSEEDQNI